MASADSATEVPKKAAPILSVTVSSVCWVQTLPLREYSHAAPTPELFSGPPTSAVLPSLDRATALPKSADPILPVGVSLACWVQTPPLWLKTQTAPMKPLSLGPPASR